MITEEILDVPNLDGSEGLLAIVVSSSTYYDTNRPTPQGPSYFDHGVHFVTPPELPLQVACMKRSLGEIIPSHTHPIRLVLGAGKPSRTQEVLVVRRGRLRVDFYNSRKMLVTSRTLCTGDIVILIAGGHGFEMIEETELVEVKQGPYLGQGDKEYI